MLRFHGITPEIVPELFNLLNPNHNGSTGEVVKFSTLRGKFVFICAHNAKDRRCGYPHIASVLANDARARVCCELDINYILWACID
jgi:hypothetical protein